MPPKVSEVIPCATQLGDFLHRLQQQGDIHTQASSEALSEFMPEAEMEIPVWLLRWTHAGINGKFAFGDDHEHSQESIFQLLEQLLYDRITSIDLTRDDPLNVFIHKGPDGVVGLYSRQNRRLTALLMLQPTRRDEMVMATHPQKWYDIKCSDYFTKRNIAGTTDRELAAMGLRHVRQTTDVCLTQRRVQILMMLFLFPKARAMHPPHTPSAT